MSTKGEAGGENARELAALASGLAAELRRRLELGVTRTARPARPAREESPRTPAAPATTRAPATQGAGGPALVSGSAPRRESAAAAENRRRAGECADLESLRELVAGCTACGLCHTRTQTVFADGSGRARVMFIGEAPGRDEDLQGVPFVGRAGRLLTDIIEKGMGLARQDVTIANVLKCRPPDNRDPRPDEKELCTPYLDRQIELVDPRVVITLGLHASQHVLSSKASMGRLRGRVHELGGRKVVATYHPAFLLRSPHMKKDCWSDIQLAMRELGLERPPAPGAGG